MFNKPDKVNYIMKTCTSAVDATADLVRMPTLVEVRFNAQHAVAVYLQSTQDCFVFIR